MPVQVFIDESGGRGQGPVFVMAALMAEASFWVEFSEAWSEVLSVSPQVRFIKGIDANGLGGEFRGFTEDERNEKVSALLPILNREELTLYHCIIYIDDFDSFSREEWGDLHRHPYVVAAHLCIMSIAMELERSGVTEKCEFIFDENYIFDSYARAVYKLLKPLHSKEVQSILPNDLLFRDDEEFLPLQAADLFAWLLHRATSGRQNNLGWIFPELNRLRLSPFSDHVDAERIKGIMRATAEVEKIIDKIRDS